MCGFLFCSFDVPDTMLEKSAYNVVKRGPDKTSILKRNGSTYVHYLLHITGKMTEQPIVSDDETEFLLYNGEVYNYQDLGTYESDGPSILDAYCNEGINGFQKLDGEYSGVIHRPSENKAVIFRDVFGTKPIYMAYDSRGLGVASYVSQLRSLNFQQILKVPVNSVLVIDIPSGRVEMKAFRSFDLNQHKDSYDDWCNAFQDAVKKRTSNSNVNYFIGLSSGYDSGLIAAVMTDIGVDFKSYSIQAAEDVGVMRQRASLVKHNEFMHLTKDQYDIQQSFLIANCEPYESPPRQTRHNGYSILKDKGAIGTGIICEKAVAEGCRVYISGQGSDEIISDYGHAGRMAPGFLHSTIAGNFPNDLSKVFPWENFFTGTQEEFLAKDEHVGGTYGLESRYPFLDYNLVQEFLWLSPKLKNFNYKAPIDFMLRKMKFPFASQGLFSKVGFRANSNFKKA